MNYKPAEKYKADFQKINKLFIVKAIISISSVGFAIGWFLYWGLK